MGNDNCQVQTYPRKHEYERRYKWNDKKAEESLSEFTGVAENTERGDVAAATIQKHYKSKMGPKRDQNTIQMHTYDAQNPTRMHCDRNERKM